MSTIAPAVACAIYQLKVSLSDLSPMIWRRLRVRSDTSIADLHAILQIAMGWEDLHLHLFRIFGKDYGITRLGGISFADDPTCVRLADFQLRVPERFLYVYDMGDNWQHEVRLERILSPDPRTCYPICTAGAGACPPEDCGGPAGYRAWQAARFSWEQVMQTQDDLLLLANRLRDWMAGGPRPTTDDLDVADALDRLREREDDTPPPFDRRAINTALREWREEYP